MLFTGLPRLPIKSGVPVEIFPWLQNPPPAPPAALGWCGCRATGTALGTAGAAACEVLPLQPQTDLELTLQPSLPRAPQIWESDESFLQLLCCSTQSKVVPGTPLHRCRPLSIAGTSCSEKALVIQQTNLWRSSPILCLKTVPDCAQLEPQGQAAPVCECPELS